MKKIFFRKILSDCLLFFFITLFSASIIIWVFQAVNFLDIVIDDGRSYLIYFQYTLLTLPKIITKIIPFSIFFSFTYIIMRYELNNELMILWNFGINKIKLVNFFLKFSFLLILIQITLTSIIIPKTQDLARSFIRESKLDNYSQFLKSKKFNDNIKDLTIYSENKENNKILKNIYLKRNLGKNNFQITYAQSGEFKNYNNVQYLILKNGETINSFNNKFTVFNFSKFEFNLDEFKTNTTTQIKTQENSTADLLKCISKLNYTKIFFINENKNNVTNCSIENLPNILKELYKRLIIPFYLPILILSSLSIILFSKENSNFLKMRFLVFAFGFLIILFSELSIRFINFSKINNIVLILLPAFFLIFFYTLLNLKFNHKIK